MTKLVFVSLLCLLPTPLFGRETAATQKSSASRVDVQIVTDEAEAVLRILSERERGQEVTEGDWQRVFQSEGYRRLQKRERSMQRPFEDADFKTFVLSGDLVKRRQALAETLAKWKASDVNSIAARPLAYLPRDARIRAKIYPVIKPRDNSFVFEINEDPAIFLYLDPTKSKEIFENEFAHELHHIGYSTACPTEASKDAIKKLPPAAQKILGWVGPFGEGFAMLAAAGGADVHPHATSPADERERWDRDLSNFNNDLKTVEKFLLDAADGRLTEEKERETGFSFFGVQGPWYTVGWQMAVVIEKTFGREKLIECMCDRRLLLPTYNEAVEKYNRKSRTQLSPWSKELISRIR